MSYCNPTVPLGYRTPTVTLFISSFGVNALRGDMGSVFGEEALRATLKTLNLKLVIRSNQVR